MRKILWLAFFTLFASGSFIYGQKSEDHQEWTSLFNGKDINDWIVKIHHHETGDNYGNTFRVEDGIIKVRYDHYDKFNDRFGHLYYKRPFSYYHLRFEYRFTGEWRKDAPAYTIKNSGFMFHSQDPKTMPRDQTLRDIDLFDHRLHRFRPLS